ncbi:MAG: MotA/TolQ/ExbB proton channel family protein [Nitrospiria bacterium]
MTALLESLRQVRLFLEMGGPVLIGMLFLSILLWILILERYWFICITHPRGLDRVVSEWRKRTEKKSWTAKRIQESLISETASTLHQSLFLIKTLCAVLPLLGLLGTVTGMIQTFDVMTRYGTGNVRGMAGGISEALITTMAGLVTAISGLFFSSDLRRRAGSETEKVAELLSQH